jgi:cobalt/nickel transport system permease protein
MRLRATFPTVGLVTALLVFSGEPAYSMHISEGILPAPWAIFWWLLSIPFIVAGLKTLRAKSAVQPQTKALVGLVGAGVFIISCMPIPVPFTGTCSHPCGTGMAAILLGPTISVLVASIALTLQALFLAHGGLTTLGANVFSMGVVGSFAAYGIFVLARRLGLPTVVCAFLAGVVGDWGTYATTALALAGGLQADGNFVSLFAAILLAFVPFQVPLGILEGVVTAGAYRFVHARRPEFIGMLVKGEAV